MLFIFCLLSVLLQLLILLLIPNSLHSLRILDTTVSCDQSNFVLTVRFEEPFHGIIYSEKNFPNCIYVNASILSQSFYTIKVPLDGCETAYNADGNLENAIVIQENPLQLDEADKKYLLTCIPASTTVSFLSETVHFGGITVDSQSITEATITATGIADQHVQYKVELYKTDSDGTLQPVNAPVFVGDDIVYVIRVSSLATDARIGHCWARDMQSTLQLSDDDGCSMQLAGEVWNHFQRNENGNDIVFRNQIKAWAFPTSNDVSISCNLHTCRTMCRHISCSGQRQRRNVTVLESGGDGSEKLHIVKTNFRVENQRKEEDFDDIQDEGRLWLRKELGVRKAELITTLEEQMTTATTTIRSCLTRTSTSKLIIVIGISLLFAIIIIISCFLLLLKLFPSSEPVKHSQRRLIRL